MGVLWTAFFIEEVFFIVRASQSGSVRIDDNAA